MSIVSNFYLKGSKKQLAGAVYYKSGGRTISRQLADSVTNPRTRAQMEQRVRWANCVAFYRANSSWMKYAYESKKAYQSEYNKFMSLNVTGNKIYLTKQAAAAGACVVDSYVMTQGSLPSITYTLGQASISTNIFVNSDSSLTPASTVAEWSAQILANNPGVQEGDQISIIRYTQMVNEATGFPYVIVRKYEVIMSLSSPQPMSNYWPADFFSVGAADNKRFVAITNTGNSGGLLMALSRTISGRTLVSTQSILPVNNSATINSWSSANALNRAINSYGESDEAFLSSVNANYVESEPISLVPLSFQVENNIWVPGEYIGQINRIAGKQITIRFNQDVSDLQGEAGIGAMGDNTLVTGAQLTFSGQTAVGLIEPLPEGYDGTKRVNRISIDCSGGQFEVNFSTSQPDMGGGGLD